MKSRIAPAVLAAVMTGFGANAIADEVSDSLTRMARTEVQEWLNSAIVRDQVKAQNSKHGGMSETEIIALDKQWRAETAASDQPLIRQVLATPLSSYLAEVKEKSGGKYTEIFVMDSVGLNVGQSDVTSDYWQGDEAKWQQTFKVGPDAIHIGDVEMDESTQQLQVQLSLPVVENGAVIGAVTIGINVDAL